MFPNFGEVMANLPAAMDQVNGVATSLDRIANALERMATVAEQDHLLRVQTYDQELLGVTSKREGDTETDDPGDHYVR